MCIAKLGTKEYKHKTYSELNVLQEFYIDEFIS